MNKTALKVGYWASVISAITFIVFTACFVAILFVNPFFTWTNLSDFIKAVQTTNQTFKHIAMSSMIVYGACFAIQICSIEEIADLSKKYYVKLGELFALGFFVLIGINYFIQISTVRMNIDAGQTRGLEQFVQVNPISAIAAINMLGWTVFFGLSCFFVSFAFGKTKIENPKDLYARIF